MLTSDEGQPVGEAGIVPQVQPDERHLEDQVHGHPEEQGRRDQANDRGPGNFRLRPRMTFEPTTAAKGRTALVLQTEVDSDVSSRVVDDTELRFEAGFVLSAVLGKERIDFSEAAGLVAVFSGPRLPFIQVGVEALSALAEELESRVAPRLGSDRSGESFFRLAPFVPAGEASMTIEFGERLFGGLSFLAGLGQVGDGSLLLPFEDRQCAPVLRGRAERRSSRARALASERLTVWRSRSIRSSTSGAPWRSSSSGTAR